MRNVQDASPVTPLCCLCTSFFTKSKCIFIDLSRASILQASVRVVGNQRRLGGLIVGRDARLNKRYRDRGEEPPWVTARNRHLAAQTAEFDQYLGHNLDKNYLDSLPPDQRRLYLDRCFLCYALELHISEEQYQAMTARLGRSPAEYLQSVMESPRLSRVSMQLHVLYAEVAYGDIAGTGGQPFM